MKVQAALVAGACALGAKVRWAHADDSLPDACSDNHLEPTSDCTEITEMTSSNSFVIPDSGCIKIEDQTALTTVKNAVLLFLETGAIDTDEHVDCENVYAYVNFGDEMLFASVTAANSRSCNVDWDSVFESIDQLEGLRVTYQVEESAFALAGTVLVQHLDEPVKVAEVYNDDYILARSISTAEATDDNEWTHTLTVTRGRYTSLDNCPLPGTITIQLGTSDDDGDFTQGTDAMCEVVANQVGDGETYTFNTDLNHIYHCGETQVETLDGETYFQMDMRPSLAQDDFDFSGLDNVDFCLGADRDLTTLTTAPTTCKTISHKRNLINTVTHSLYLQQVETVDGSDFNAVQYLVKVIGHDMEKCDNELDFYGKLQLIVEINVSPDQTDSTFWEQVLALHDDNYQFLENFIQARVDGDSDYTVVPMDACPSESTSRRLTQDSNPSRVCFKVNFNRCQKLAAAGDNCEFSYLGAVELGVTTCNCYVDSTSEENNHNPFDEECCTVMTVKEPVIPCSSVVDGILVDSCQFECPTRDVENKINPEFELDMTATCEDGPLSLNNEINIAVSLKDRGDATTHGFTFYIRELTVSLHEPVNDALVKQVTFLRSAKKIAFYFGTSSSPYTYDAHFCRAESGAEGSETCVPFYDVLDTWVPDGITSLLEGDSSAIISRPAVQTEFEYGRLTYSHCVPITDRHLDHFFFTPRYWGFNDYDGLTGKLEVSATVVLSHCDDPTSSRLLRASTTRTLQEAAQGAVVGSGSFTIVNQANDDADCASKGKKQCKGQCLFAKGLISGQDCMSEAVFQNGFTCADLNGNKKLCGMKSGCTYNKKAKTCDAKEATVELSCGDMNKKKCNKNDKCILESWNGGKKAACVAKSSVNCSAVPKKMCKSKLLKDYCAWQGKECDSA